MSHPKICGVYKITHIASGKSYIGVSKDINRRWAEHRACSGRRNSAIYAAIRKHGIDSFSWQIIEQCEVDMLPVREQHWIAVFDTFRNGYNLTTGGEHKKEISYETRQKISKSHTGKKLSEQAKSKLKGRKQSAESIEKSRIARTGIKRSEEAKAKMSASHKGKKLSEETKKKISEATRSALAAKKLASLQVDTPIQ